MQIETLSAKYTVRRLTDADAPAACALCAGNPLYYAHCPPAATPALFREDLRALPPGKSARDKYYLGFFDGAELLALLDLIDAYPQPDVAFIGFFMMSAARQGRGLGSALIGELCAALAGQGRRALRLAWVKGNAQAERFWLKNGFTPREETFSGSAGQRVVLAERPLAAE